MRHVLAVWITVHLALVSVGCSKKQKGAELESQLVGVWSFNPREQLPPEAIDDVAFVTPDQIILEIGPAIAEDNGGRRGDYSRYRHTPKSEHAPEHWDVKHSKWFVVDAKLTFQGEAEETASVTPEKAQLKLDGLVKLPCKGGCRLQRIAAVPAAQKEACKQPSDAPPGREVSCAR